MAKKKFRITEKDFLLANRKASREEEIAKYGKQITFRTTIQKSKKVYDRKRLKKAGIGSDDLPFHYFDRPAFVHFREKCYPYKKEAVWKILNCISIA